MLNKLHRIDAILVVKDIIVIYRKKLNKIDFNQFETLFFRFLSESK